MKTIPGSFLLITLTVFFFSCNKKQLAPADYLHYVEDESNGLRRSVSIDGWRYTIQYKPYDYIILKEQKNTLTDSSYGARLNQLEGTVWFNLSFKKENSSTSPLKYRVSSITEYEQRYSYYLNEAPKDIILVYGKDTLSPISYVFETSYNLAPQETMVIGFDIGKNRLAPGNKFQMIFFDRIFKNGLIKATFEESTLINIPKLIIDNI